MGIGQNAPAPTTYSSKLVTAPNDRPAANGGAPTQSRQDLIPAGGSYAPPPSAAAPVSNAPANWGLSSNKATSAYDPQNINGLTYDANSSLKTGNQVFRDSQGNLVRQMNRGSNNVYAADVNAATGIQGNGATGIPGQDGGGGGPTFHASGPATVPNPAYPGGIGTGAGTGGSNGGVAGGAGGTGTGKPLTYTAQGGSAINDYGGGGFGVGSVGAVNDASRKRVEQAVMSRLNPQYDLQKDKMRNQLATQGLEVGAPGYTSEMERLDRGYNDALQSAVLTGGQEESRQVGLNSGLQQQAYNQGMGNAQFDNNIRQQMLAEMLMQRQLPLNELNSLRTGTQTPPMQNPNGYYTNNANGSPLFDAAVAQGNANSAAAGNNAGIFSSIAGLGGAAMNMFSDIRLKKNLKKLGSLANGLGWYSWDWKNGTGSSVGVIAQEVQGLMPSAVSVADNGYMMVDYGQIGV